MNTRIRFALLLALAGVITLGGSVLAAAGGDSDVAIVRQARPGSMTSTPPRPPATSSVT